ncbi:MAG: hypothetical protein JF626_05815 [Polaromonas sp.]|nr:hypothetical protein [Polaromonas sp.]
MNTSIQIPLIELPVLDIDEHGEPSNDEAQAKSSTGELLRGLLLGIGALVSVHVVWQVALLTLHWLGLLP